MTINPSDPTLICGLCCDGPAIGRWWEIGTSKDDVPDVAHLPILDNKPGRIVMTDLPEGTRTVDYEAFGKATLVMPDPRYFGWAVCYREVVQDGDASLAHPHLPRMILDDIAAYVAARITQDQGLQLADPATPAEQ